MHIQNVESGINHPANEESLFYIFPGRSELSLASRRNFNIQQDSRELKRKTALVQPPASAFYFQETGLRSCANALGRWGDGVKLRIAAVGFGAFSQDLGTRIPL